MEKRRRFIGQKFFAAFLAITLVFSNFGYLFNAQEYTAQASTLSVGEIKKESTVTISPGVVQQQLEVTSAGGPLKIYNMEVDPKNPFVKFEAGSSFGKLAGFQTVTDQAALITKPGYQVVGGVNADFFNTSNGIPIEAVVHDGRIMRSNSTRSIVGILKSGEVKIGKLKVSIQMTVTPAGTQTSSEPINVTSINRERGANDLVIFNSDYDSSTYTNTSGTEVVLEKVSDTLKPVGQVTAVVKEVRSGQGNTSLAEGQFVLSGAGTSQAVLDKLQAGDQITINTSTTAPFDQLDEAVGGYHILVTKGAALTNKDTAINPRTAVGIKADGSVFFTAIDGRQPGFSEGVTLTDLGIIMKDLGAVEAINLDGGGSTTFAARQPGDSQLSVVNSPSDGSQRKVANTLLVVSTAPQGTKVSHLSVVPSSKTILAGSHTSFSVKGQDEYFNPAAITEPIQWTADDGLGKFDSNGIFQASTKAMTGNVTASVHAVSSSAQVKVVDQLDRIDLGQTDMAIGQGAAVKVNPKGYLNGEAILSDDNAFKYELENNIGTIDENGNFVAVKGTASGFIKVSYGNVVAKIKVDVGRPPVILEGFENGLSAWTKSGARFNTINISDASSPEPVRFGNHSLRLDYDFIGQKGTSGAYAQPVDDIVLDGYPEKIGMWFYGANDGHWLRAQMKDGNDKAFAIDFNESTPGVDWNGWKYIEAVIPKGKTTPLKLDLAIRVMQTSDAKKNANTVYVDNIRAVYGETNDDLINPTLTEAFPADGATTPAAQPQISVVAKDNDGGTGIDPTKTVMKLDGEVVNHEYDPLTGKITYKPASFLAGGYHQVSVLAKDGFENPTELNWSFFISAGTQYELTGPEKVYAGGNFNVDVKVKGIKELTDTTATLIFNPKVLQVVDQDEKTEGVQVKVGTNITNDNIQLLSVDNQKGEIRVNTTKLAENTKLTATNTLITIPFKASTTTNEKIKVDLVNGSFKYIRGDEKRAYHKPFEAEIGYKYKLDVNGLSVGSHTKLQVTTEDGSPAEGVPVQVLAPSSLTKYVEVKGAKASVYANADKQSELVTEFIKGQQLLVASEGAAFTEIYLPNGNKGYVANEDVTIHDIPSPIGVTDKNGVVTTPLLALAQLEYQLQATKDGQVSAVKTVKIVPQMGKSTPEHIILSWTKDPKTTQSVTWRTNPLTTDSVVQYAPTSQFKGFDAANIKAVHGSSQLLVDAIGEMNMHEATMEGLTPNTSYTYRVGSDAGWSDAYTFTTESAKKDPYTFLFATDSQALDVPGFEIYRNLFNAALTKYPEAKFMLHAGDIVDDGAKMQQWEYFFDAIDGLSAKTPMQFVLGNHDTFGEGENNFKLFFANPENGPVDGKEWTYSFDYGDVHFAMLNTEVGSDAMKAQTEWLKEDMAKTNKKWKIVMFHRPPYLSNPLRGADASLTIFAPVVEQLGIDLVLLGHDHAYARTYPMKNGENSVPGKGTVYLIGGTSGPKFYPEQQYSYFEKLYGVDTQVFMAMKVDGNSLKVTATNLQGEEIDTFELKKDNKLAASKTYNLKNFKTKKLVITTPNSSVDLDETSTIPEGLLVKTTATLKGTGLKNTKVIINPTQKDAVVDLSGVEVKEIQIDSNNIQEIRGAENVKKWSKKNGVDLSSITYYDSLGREITPQ